jgi:hypothetical protein
VDREGDMKPSQRYVDGNGDPYPLEWLPAKDQEHEALLDTLKQEDEPHDERESNP